MSAAEVYYDEEESELPDEPDYIWMPEEELHEDPIILRKAQKNLKQLPKIKPSQFTSAAFMMPTEVEVNGQQTMGLRPFSFKERPHLLRIYDTPCRRVLLMCARQVEKTVVVNSNILLENGQRLAAKDVEVGCRVATLGNSGSWMESGEVIWKSHIYKKPCVRIKTRQGHTCEVALTHPMRQWERWTEAGHLRVGDRLAVVRRAGDFGTAHQPAARIALTAYLIGDGHIDERAITFTTVPGPTLDDFLSASASIGERPSIYQKKGTPAVDVRLNSRGQLGDWLDADGLLGTRSATKFIPAWVFNLSQSQTALFINRLWSTDGHVKRNSESKYSIEYCSISKRLILDVQALLWKFGIPSRIRENWPNVYKKRGERKMAYILRVETRDGVNTFLSSIGALGKSENVVVSTSEENNNRDTYPLEVNDLLRQIIASNPRTRYGRYAEGSLRSAGLRETLEYPPSKAKLERYAEFFRTSQGYSWPLIRKLLIHLSTDLFWDEIVSIESIGEQDCIDFEIAGTHNFVADGFVTHNSTMLGNISLSYSCIVPGYRTLYVSPSATQTKTFSADRIKEPIETSPILRQFTTSMLSQNILEKQFINRSKITLRYAFLNADRCRGIPAYALLLDELQDLLNDNIPVIEACQNHAPHRWRRNIYSGTPKSLDNTIESYWSGQSTMNEWVVPCEGCNFWNILGEKNIGKKGPICEKCGKLLHPQHPRAQWAAQRQYDDVKVPFEGYRINQLMVPWVDWNEILIAYERNGRDKFYNETLGISYDSGMRPLTRAQVMACCNPNITMTDLKWYKQQSHGTPVFAGIDWGTGENSYTVLTLAMYVDRKFRVFYMHRFTGDETEPDRQMELIVQLLKYFNVALIGVDYGGGFHPNDRLTREFGKNKVWKYQYANAPKQSYKWNSDLHRFMLHRSEVMSQIFNAIKRKRECEFPRWEEFEKPYAQDFLNIYSESNDVTRIVQYKHSVDKPDDSFHSFLYCWLVSMVMYRRPDIIKPNKEDPNGNQIPMYSGISDQG